jgi:hypothetical protein
MRYFANAGPDRGPIVYGTTPDAIGVIEDLEKPIPVGMALCVGVDAAGRALWTLSVEGQDLSGRWIVEDGEFQPAP